MAKTKKMAFGGLGGRPVAGNAPQQFMSNALRSGAMKPTQGMMGGNGPAPANALRPMPARMPAPQGMMGGNGPAPAGAPSPQIMQFMSDKMRGGPAPTPAISSPQNQANLGAMLSKVQPPQATAGGRMPGGQMFKKGGKVKSASARADGIAIRGKTRA